MSETGNNMNGTDKNTMIQTVEKMFENTAYDSHAPTYSFSRNADFVIYDYK